MIAAFWGDGILRWYMQFFPLRLGNGLITYVRYGVYPIVSTARNGGESALLTEVQ